MFRDGEKGPECRACYLLPCLAWSFALRASNSHFEMETGLAEGRQGPRFSKSVTKSGSGGFLLRCCENRRCY